MRNIIECTGIGVRLLRIILCHKMLSILSALMANYCARPIDFNTALMNFSIGSCGFSGTRFLCKWMTVTFFVIFVIVCVILVISVVRKLFVDKRIRFFLKIDTYKKSVGTYANPSVFAKASPPVFTKANPSERLGRLLVFWISWYSVTTCCSITSCSENV